MPDAPGGPPPVPARNFDASHGDAPRASPDSLILSARMMTRDGVMRPNLKTAAFRARLVDDPKPMDGRTLAVHQIDDPRDVHYPVWEMHPEGDELLIAASGSLSVEFQEGETARVAPLAPRAACVVPAGTWHRLIVHEPSVLIAITPRRNTVQERR